MINNLNNFCQYFCKKLILAYVLTLIFTYVGSAADKAAYRVQIDKDEYGNERPCVPHTLQNADLKGTQIIEISPAKQDVPIMLDGMDAPRRGDIDEMVGTTRGEANRVCLGLSIDGGGIRGLMPALWLERLEEFVIDEIDEKRRLSDIFDCIGGTSIGGILSLGLAKPIPASELVKILREKGDQVFPQNKTWYVPNLLYNAYRNATDIFAKK